MTALPRTLASILAAVLLALGCVWAAPAPAYACSCRQRADAEYTADAEVIFTGTVASDRVTDNPQVRSVAFTVDRVYKGTAAATQAVTTNANGGSCGLELIGPGPFTVFADLDQSGLTANACGGTRSGPVPASLGPGQAPQPSAAPASPAAAPPANKGTWVPLVGLILAMTAAAVLGLSLIRPRAQ